jgi:hypothetical protein
MKTAIDTTQTLSVEARVTHALNVALAHVQVALDLSGGTLPKEAEGPMEALHWIFVTFRRKPRSGVRPEEGPR